MSEMNTIRGSHPAIPLVPVVATVTPVMQDAWNEYFSSLDHSNPITTSSELYIAHLKRLKSDIFSNVVKARVFDIFDGVPGTISRSGNFTELTLSRYSEMYDNSMHPGYSTRQSLAAKGR
jgi:hypothetical protein